MAGVNRVILVGNLGTTPESKTLENGNVVCTFSLATSESYKDKAGQKVEQTEWHEIEVWGKLAEIAGKYLTIGMPIYLEGSIKSNKWTDKEGNNRKTTRIKANIFTMLGSKGGANTNPSDVKSGASPKPSFEPTGDFDGEMSDIDDLPF